MAFGGGETFGQVFADKSGGETRPCGKTIRGDGGGLGQNDGAEGQLMLVLDNVGLGGKCMDVVRLQDHEVLPTAERGDGKTSSLFSAYFSSELECL